MTIFDERADHVQVAWLEALSRTDHRPNASTPQELRDNYQHLAGLVGHIADRERSKRLPFTLPLTEDTFMVYNRENDLLDDCTVEQREAVDYFLRLLDVGRPLTASERHRLYRLRKKTGLALKIQGV